MKNSQPMMKNRMMPVRISANEWFSPSSGRLATSFAPYCMNTIKNDEKIMPIGLNFDIHETMTAV
jgi:hypothetical protein